jgi:hypothetical protein
MKSFAASNTIDGLFPITGRAVDLGARLLITVEQVQRDARRDRGLSVLPRHLDVRGPVSPRPIGPLPAEQRSDDLIPLPWVQDERAAPPTGL